MKWDKNLRIVRFYGMDMVLAVGFVGSFWSSLWIHDTTSLTDSTNFIFFSLIIMGIAFLMRGFYRWMLPHFSPSNRWKPWHLLAYTLDVSLLIFLLFWWRFPHLVSPGGFKVLVIFVLFSLAMAFSIATIASSVTTYFSLERRYKMQPQPFPHHLSSFYKQEVILITGAAGFIGSELARRLTTISSATVLLLDQSENGLQELLISLPKSKATIIPILGDIRSYQQLSEVFEKYQPTLVYHTAAYKQLPVLEQYPIEAFKTNILGTQNLVKLALQQKTKKLIFISTDKAVNPTSILGITKKIAEASVTSNLQNNSNTEWAVVRFGNVWNSTGSVLPVWEQQLSQSGSIEVRDLKASRYFISASNVANLLLEIGAFPKLNQTYLCSMNSPIVIRELAAHYLQWSQFYFIPKLNIKLTTLLEGEKLEESLIAVDEKIESSTHPQIKVIKKIDQVFSEDQWEKLMNDYQTISAEQLKHRLFSFIRTED